MFVKSKDKRNKIIFLFMVIASTINLCSAKQVNDLQLYENDGMDTLFNNHKNGIYLDKERQFSKRHLVIKNKSNKAPRLQKKKPLKTYNKTLEHERHRSLFRVIFSFGR